MPIGDLNALVALLLAISLAGERLVTAVKNAFPKIFAIEAKNEANQVDLPRDRWRRVSVQTLGFIFCWGAAAFMTGTDGFHPFRSMPIGVGHGIPAVVVGLLTSSGSAFWSSVLGYTSAVKDARREGIGLAERAAALRAKLSVDSSVAGRSHTDGLPVLEQPRLWPAAAK